MMQGGTESYRSYHVSSTFDRIRLPTTPNAAPSGGYIRPNDLITKVLPYIKDNYNYGWVMLWDRFHDV